VDTAELIKSIVGGAAPVRRLLPPMTRAALWIAISLPYVTFIALLRHWAAGLPVPAFDVRFLVMEFAAVATAITAAIAALCCTIPGRDHRVMFIPLLPLGIWLASLGEAYVNDVLRRGGIGLGWRSDWGCAELAAVIGFLPAVAIVLMLRHGAPLYPRATLALGALAVAALGNAGLQIVHAGDMTATVVLWHLAAMAILTALAGLMGPWLLNWQHKTVTTHARSDVRHG